MLMTPSVFKDDASGELSAIHSKDLTAKLARIEEKYELYLKMRGSHRADGHTKGLQRALIASFLKAAIAVKKCEGCGGSSPKIRKDGFSKIYQRTLGKRERLAMQSLRFSIKSGMESLAKGKGKSRAAAEDSDDEEEAVDSDDDEGDSSMNKSTDNYLVPLEVEAQMQLLWAHCPEMLEFIWSRALLPDDTAASSTKPAESWRLFFVRTVLVPPNRFRPPSLVGSELAEHPQNIILSNVIVANESIEKLRAGAKKEGQEEAMEVVGTVESKPVQMDMTRLITQWISLQNAVNCYMDSDKDASKKQSEQLNGIRQLLERKEGLFRRHMMGKRVNYCCRSVISPDPYIGANEIGIPVKFAKSLHIPTPVAAWNFKMLREMVVRGPDQYPGTPHDT
jgi:DNA-directed RNA polymerase I subunit RPA1